MKKNDFLIIKVNKQFVAFDAKTQIYAEGDQEEEALNNLIEKLKIKQN